MAFYTFIKPMKNVRIRLNCRFLTFFCSIYQVLLPSTQSLVRNDVCLLSGSFFSLSSADAALLFLVSWETDGKGGALNLEMTLVVIRPFRIENWRCSVVTW